MRCDEQLVERIRATLVRQPNTDERRMFGGVCFTLNGNMVCGVVGTDLMVRVGPDRYQDALQQPHVREMDFTGRAMKGYVFVGAQGIKDELALRNWIDLGVAHVGGLPEKTRNQRATTSRR